MAFIFAEYAATLIAFVFTILLLLGGGALFARALRFPGFVEAALVERAGISLLCGFAALPVALDLAGRFGPHVMASVAAILAVAGAPALLGGAARKIERGGMIWVAAGVAWVLLSVTVMIDWPTASGLSHGLLVVDYVKHAAVTWSVAQSGTPPWNPTFFDPGRHSVYYYFYYTLTASVNLLAAPLGVQARHASYAGGSVVGFAFMALFYQVWRRAATDSAAGGKESSGPPSWGFLALAVAGGLDILPVLGIALGTNGEVWLRDPGNAWDEQVTPWASSTLWVPHHVAALCAAFVAFMSLARPGGGGDPRRILLAALAFASMAGLSVYVAMGGVSIAGVWLILLLRAKRFEDAAHLALAGVGALVAAAPWLVTLMPMIGGQGPSPIAFRLRGPVWISNALGSDLTVNAARLLFLPISYALHFGIFGLGAWLFWKQARRRGGANDLAQILVIGAVASLLIGAFVRSKIQLNDLGWRIMMFAQLAALVWTYSALRAGAFDVDAATKTAQRWLLALGYATMVYTFVMMRWERPYDPFQSAVLRDEVSAWAWLDARLPTGAVAQAQPDVYRNLAFGLYGRFPAAVSDHHNGVLFGPSKDAVESRIAEIAPIFSNPSLSFDEVRRVAARNGVSALVVTALDSVFADPKSWVATAATSYANEHVRVYLLPEAEK